MGESVIKSVGKKELSAVIKRVLEGKADEVSGLSVIFSFKRKA